jgi:hypothetical protein
MFASGNTTFGDFPPSSSVTRFRFPTEAARIFLPTSVEPVKATLSMPGCSLIELPAPGPISGDDVHYAFGQTRFEQQITEEECRERRLLRRLQDHRVAACGRRRDLPRRHHDRRVPRGDRAQALELGELVGTLLDEVRPLSQQTRAVVRRRVCPRPLGERLASGLHRLVDVRLVAFRTLGEGLLVGRVDGLEGLSALGGDPLVADQQAVLVGLVEFFDGSVSRSP